MFTHKVGIIYSSDAGTITNTTDSYTGDGEANFDNQITASTTNAEIDLSFAHTPIKSMVIWSDHALVIKVNSTSAPDDTITLVAGKQIVWTVDHPEACPITADVTKLYVTNPDAVSAKLKFRVLLDTTPVLPTL